MVSTPEVVIRFVGKGELRRLGARVRRIYQDLRSRLKRQEREDRGTGAERSDTAEESVGDRPQEEMEVAVSARPVRRRGHKVKPAADHPWRKFRYGRRSKK